MDDYGKYTLFDSRTGNFYADCETAEEIVALLEDERGLADDTFVFEGDVPLTLVDFCDKMVEEGELSSNPFGNAQWSYENITLVPPTLDMFDDL